MRWFLGFVVTFTLGGMSGVLLSIPAADFELHNSLFLVAHFHNTIIGGVIFGYFAGLTYWFPKIFGYKLHEGLGIAVVWSWIVGFLVAFIPLYILGFMGATRRLDHYTNPDWQPLFIIAGVGAMIIGFGVVLQVAQMIVSYRNRKKNTDHTGDPWNGRTLEWSVPSPAPFYNFAHIPTVYGHDAFWAMKHSDNEKSHEPYEDILLPKNSPLGLFAAAFAFLLGFGFVWHISWLITLGALGALGSLIARALDEHTEYVVPAHAVERTEKRLRHTL
jgi:cytochrome o ubiquinol oxidase subunit 1